MKKATLIIAILFAANAVKAQNYADSLITLQLPRVASWWVTKSIESQITANNYRDISVFKPFVRDSTKPDSLFTVTLKAGYIKSALELLITRPLELALVDRLKIIENQRVASTSVAIVGYTGLAAQITTLANGNGAQKNVAKWLRDWYIGRTQDFLNLYRQERDDVIKLVQ
jgi:hypothetical protein